MIKWPIEYVDYNGEKQKEDFYFNLSKAEVLELNLAANGAYDEYLKRIVEQRDGAKMAEEFKKLILMSYGEKTPDGRRFVKSKELTDSFVQTEAYSELFIQLATDTDACEKFVTGILPKIESDSNPNLENHMNLV